jgi:tetratricopeptide (TPR) repeat protein
MSPPRLLRPFLLALGVTVFCKLSLGGEPITAPPPAANNRYTQGQDLEKQGKTKEAIAAYEEAIRLGMQLFPRVHLQEAAAYLQLKDYEAAIAKYTKLIDDFGLEDSCRH